MISNMKALFGLGLMIYWQCAGTRLETVEDTANIVGHILVCSDLEIQNQSYLFRVS